MIVRIRLANPVVRVVAGAVVAAAWCAAGYALGVHVLVAAAFEQVVDQLLAVF